MITMIEDLSMITVMMIVAPTEIGHRNTIKTNGEIMDKITTIVVILLAIMVQFGMILIAIIAVVITVAKIHTKHAGYSLNGGVKV